MTTADNVSVGRVPTEPLSREGVGTRSRVRVWPAYLLAAPAMVAIWSGWVGLGEKTGFGVVHPLPGIVDSFTINTAITLPIGMDTYAAYAMSVWLGKRPVPDRARTFAKRSAILALVLGYFGQVAFHVLSAWGIRTAPTAIVVLVAGIPVGVFGMGAALIHLLQPEQPEQEQEQEQQPEQENDDRNDDRNDRNDDDQDDDDQDSTPDVPDIRKHRPAAETARLARQWKRDEPELTQAQLAARLSISERRLRTCLSDHPEDPAA